MSAYKQFTTKDIVITPFSANKGFSFTGDAMTASNVGIEVYFGTQPPANKLIFEPSTNTLWTAFVDPAYVSGSQNITGFVNKQNTNSIYSSTMQLYYSNYFGSQSGSLVATSSFIYGLRGDANNTFASYNNIDVGLSGSNNLPIGDVKSPQYYNYLSSTIPQIRTALLGENVLVSGFANNNHISVVSIPSKLYGNNIEPQSTKIIWNPGGGAQQYTVYDDGNGNLFYNRSGSGDFINNQYCGNVCYEHGNLILTPISASEDNPYSSEVSALSIVGRTVLVGQPGYNAGIVNLQYLTVGFSSSVTLYEHQYKCVVRENEFGYSLNPSLLSGSQSEAPLLGTNYVYKDFATGSYFSPYITTVGLYDNDQNLLAIGKLSTPTKVPMNADLEIQIAFDSI